VFALGAEGGEGVRRMLRLMEAELRIAMALTGVTRARDFGPAALA
jgi:L-lactate dehydrogenase (cytochrome)